MKKELIKFRAWDTLQGGKFEYWDPLMDKHDGIFWTMIKNKSFKAPNQYTGEKDKNGKEIYEGDLFKIGTEKDIFEVRFMSGCFMAMKKGKQFGLLGEIANIFLTVIGNIYENPELWKDTVEAYES